MDGKDTPQGAFGKALAERFRVHRAVSFLHQTLNAGPLAVTEIRDNAPEPGISGDIPSQDAFLLTLHLEQYVDHTAWETGRQYPVRTIRQGDLLVRDLRHGPTVLVDKPHHELHFYIPRTILNAITEQHGAPRIEELRYQPGEPIDDMVVRGLGSSLTAAFAVPEQANRLFLDHVLLGVATHCAQTYGGFAPQSRPIRGGLAQWQQKRAMEFIRANLKGDIRLEDIAQSCGISISHFTRAFRQSVGMPPHQWLLQQRIEQAKARIKNADESLSEIALACGFADQSHLSRVFSRFTGATPAAWRRLNRI
jgi:AraC-like DNA-binding protein